MRVRLESAARLILASLAGAACNGSDKGVTQPNTAKACSASGTTQLSPLQALSVACTAGTTVTLPGNGASYLIAPNLATSGVPNQPTSYTIGIVAGSSSNRVPVFRKR